MPSAEPEVALAPSAPSRPGFRQLGLELKLFFHRLVPALNWPARQKSPVAIEPCAVAKRASPNNFDALRLIAALMVVYGHEGLDGTGTGGLRLLMFFSISGYLIAGSWHADPDVRRFLLRRFLRLWPAYACCIVVCAALSALFPARDMPDISRMASMFYLKNLWFSTFDWGFFPFRDALMNRSLWMIAYEVDFYLAFVALAWLNGRLLPLWAGALVVAALVGARFDVSQQGGLLESWSLHFTGYFAFGVLLRVWPDLRRGKVLGAVVLCGLALLACDQRETGLLLLIPAAAVWIGNQSWPIFRSAARWGDLSLGIFLWAWPAGQLLKLWMPGSTPSLSRFAILVVLTLGLAWLSSRYIETPALRRKPARPPAHTQPIALQTQQGYASDVAGATGCVSASGHGPQRISSGLCQARPSSLSTASSGTSCGSAFNHGT